MIINTLLITAIVLVVALAFIKSDKRYAYCAALSVAVLLVVKEYLRGDMITAGIMGIVFASLTYRERRVFLGAAAERKWQKWPWY